MSPMSRSFLEATARQRIRGLLDPASFTEMLPPTARVVSPHLQQVDAPCAFDDGAVVGRGLCGGRPVLLAAEEGGFMGGAVGEVHGAKLTGLLKRALDERPAAVLLLIDSGGVRLHEANAGLIAVSEIIRALLTVRAAGTPVLALIGGKTGCFGGMGIVARCCDAVVMSEQARLGLSGPEVIETTHGVEEFDSRDKAVVWQTLGGKHRYILGDADRLVEDDLEAFREAITDLLATVTPVFALEALEREHAKLSGRLQRFGSCADARDIWEGYGIAESGRLPLFDVSEFLHAVGGNRG